MVRGTSSPDLVPYLFYSDFVEYHGLSFLYEFLTSLPLYGFPEFSIGLFRGLPMSILLNTLFCLLYHNLILGFILYMYSGMFCINFIYLLPLSFRESKLFISSSLPLSFRGKRLWCHYEQSSFW